MIESRTYTAVLPLAEGDDVDVARWLARESFEVRATADALRVTKYAERVMSTDEATERLLVPYRRRGQAPPSPLLVMGCPVKELTWYELTATATFDQPVFEWLTAECAWRNEQIAAWVEAEQERDASRV